MEKIKISVCWKGVFEQTANNSIASVCFSDGEKRLFISGKEMIYCINTKTKEVEKDIDIGVVVTCISILRSDFFDDPILISCDRRGDVNLFLLIKNNDEVRIKVIKNFRFELFEESCFCVDVIPLDFRSMFCCVITGGILCTDYIIESESIYRTSKVGQKIVRISKSGKIEEKVNAAYRFKTNPDFLVFGTLNGRIVRYNWKNGIIDDTFFFGGESLGGNLNAITSYYDSKWKREILVVSRSTGISSVDCLRGNVLRSFVQPSSKELFKFLSFNDEIGIVVGKSSLCSISYSQLTLEEIHDCDQEVGVINEMCWSGEEKDQIQLVTCTNEGSLCIFDVFGLEKYSLQIKDFNERINFLLENGFIDFRIIFSPPFSFETFKLFIRLS